MITIVDDNNYPAKANYMTRVAKITTITHGSIHVGLVPDNIPNVKNINLEEYINKWEEQFTTFPYMVKNKYGVYKITEKDFMGVMFYSHNPNR